jgi:hypothetical protein
LAAFALGGKTRSADGDVELPVNGLARDFDLELLGDVGLVERPAALAAVYGTFTEGFTTPDLVDAAALLNSLA